ncbi:hypothetical protein SSX86_032798, partial [Deinandra increscens subsp. villosa]
MDEALANAPSTSPKARSIETPKNEKGDTANSSSEQFAMTQHLLSQYDTLQSRIKDLKDAAEYELSGVQCAGNPHFWVNDRKTLEVIYGGKRNLLNVLDFLKRPNASALVSGTRDRVNLHDKFKQAIEAYFHGTIDELTKKVEERKADLEKPLFWDLVKDSNSG